MDTLGNILTKIRNGYAVRKESVLVPLSKLNLAVTSLLKKEGYLSAVKEIADPASGHQVLELTLRYNQKEPAIERIRRVSRPGRRVYVGASQIPRPKNGFGTMILSTPAGVVTGTEATKRNMGGEVLCEVIRGVQA